MTRPRFLFAAVVLLMLAFIFGTKMASADAWEAFESRCIAPMENFDAPILDGLEPAEITSPAAAQVDTDGAKVYGPGDQSYALVVEGEEGCLVVVNAASPEDWAKAEAWRDASLADARYQQTETPGEYHSTPWREPVFSVALFFDPDLGVAVFTARHTNLET